MYFYMYWFIFFKFGSTSNNQLVSLAGPLTPFKRMSSRPLLTLRLGVLFSRIFLKTSIFSKFLQRCSNLVPKSP